jgi:hypothetical protein
MMRCEGDDEEVMRAITQVLDHVDNMLPNELPKPVQDNLTTL